MRGLGRRDGLCGEEEAEEEGNMRIEMKPGIETMTVHEVDAERVGESFSYTGDFQ